MKYELQTKTKTTLGNAEFMKYLLLTIAAITLACSTPSFADPVTPDTLQVDVTRLDSEQLRVYQQMKAMQNQTAASMALENLTPDKIDKYAQMGKGLGVAINEGLGAVTKNVEQFAQTSAGKWIMVLVTWKVMGEDAINLTRTAMQYIIGSILFTVGIPFWIWLVRRNCVERPILTIEKTGFWKKKITYADRSDPLHEEWIILYGLCFLVYLVAVAAITFLH